MDMDNKEFNHQVAQDYEMKWHIIWVEENNNRQNILNEIAINKETQKINPIHFKEFFKEDIDLWNKFVDHVKTKNCLEVSGGICGALPLMKHWLLGNLTSIDPLIVKSDEYLKNKGDSWFDGINIIDKCAEEFIVSLHNEIDGFIIWRNGLDHIDKPDLALSTISSYAMKGCKLLFWCDIKHFETPDEGHRNLCETKEEMEEKLIKLGWSIDYRTDGFREVPVSIEYGCVATKL